LHGRTAFEIFQQSISPRITNHQFADVGLQQVIQPGGPGSFLEGHLDLSALPIDKAQDRVRFGFDDAFHHDLAGSIPDRDRDAFLMHVHADIFIASHKRVSILDRLG